MFYKCKKRIHSTLFWFLLPWRPWISVENELQIAPSRGFTYRSNDSISISPKLFILKIFADIWIIPHYSPGRLCFPRRRLRRWSAIQWRKSINAHASDTGVSKLCTIENFLPCHINQLSKKCKIKFTHKVQYANRIFYFCCEKFLAICVDALEMVEMCLDDEIQNTYC